MNINKLLPEIVEIAQEAGIMLKKIQKGVKEVKKENHADFLTTADLKSNTIIAKKLLKLAPEIPVYSEEAKIKINQNQLTWIIDPLDGTRNFFHQDVNWGVTIALVRGGNVELGTIFLPALNWLAGATREDEVIVKGEYTFGVSKETELSSDTQLRSEWTKYSRELPANIFLKLALSKAGLTQIRGCASAGYMAVSFGQIDGYIMPEAPIEDMAAGALIVKRAGGKITDRNGNAWTASSNSILASNGFLHEQILEIIK